jgi:hypothetical protein
MPIGMEETFLLAPCVEVSTAQTFYKKTDQLGRKEKTMMSSKLMKGITTLIFCLIIPANGYSQDRSPSEIVQLFNTCYGTAKMDEIADFTTENFRNNKPKSVWIAETWEVLRQIAYKREKGSILGSKIAKKRAAVAIQARFETVAGKTEQKEIFYLIKIGNDWLIDELKVAEEKVELNMEGLQL